MAYPTTAILDRLAGTEIAWCTTLRPDGSPHTTPVWFTSVEGAWWIASAAGNVKVRNVTADPRVSLAFGDGRTPVVLEGRGLVLREVPSAVAVAFAAKYAGWDITDQRPDGPRVLVKVTVTRWLMLGDAD